MKREIKFRGKRLDNGEWIEGTPVWSVNDRCYMIVGAEEAELIDKLCQVECAEVDPETVGEYTGMNGIFEDDIINVRFGANNEPIPMQVLLENGSWCIKEYWDDTLHDLYSYEDEIEGVIGNMFDSTDKFITE